MEVTIFVVVASARATCRCNFGIYNFVTKYKRNNYSILVDIFINIFLLESS